MTNQAIQVLQGPYMTNTYGDGISCQVPTANITPYATRTGSWTDPYEDYWLDPVYNNLDANDDGVPDNPGEILFYKPVRTGQKANQNVNIGFSATISFSLDKKAQEQCKEAAKLHNEYRAQLTANKRLDFELARLKNCGELMQAGITFHKKSPYASICADVVVTNPGGQLVPHTHKLPQPNFEDSSSETPSSDSQSSSLPSSELSPSSHDSSQKGSEVDLSSLDTHSSSVLPESDDKGFFQGLSSLFRSPSSQQVSQPSGADQLGVLQVGQMTQPQTQSPQ